MRFVYIFISLFVLADLATAGEKQAGISLAETPEPVRKSIQKEVGKGKVTHIDRHSTGEQLYIVEITNGKTSKEIDVTPGGVVAAIKEPITLNRVTPAARKAILSSAGKGKIVSLRAVKSPQGVISTYEVKFMRSGKVSTERFSPGAPMRIPD